MHVRANRGTLRKAVAVNENETELVTLKKQQRVQNELHCSVLAFIFRHLQPSLIGVTLAAISKNVQQNLFLCFPTIDIWIFCG